MTNNANLSPAFGSDLLLRSVAELRELYGRFSDEINEQNRDDFAHLFQGAKKLESLLDPDQQGDNQRRNTGADVHDGSSGKI